MPCLRPMAPRKPQTRRSPETPREKPTPEPDTGTIEQQGLGCCVCPRKALYSMTPRQLDNAIQGYIKANGAGDESEAPARAAADRRMAGQPVRGA